MTVLRAIRNIVEKQTKQCKLVIRENEDLRTVMSYFDVSFNQACVLSYMISDFLETDRSFLDAMDIASEIGVSTVELAELIPDFDALLKKRLLIPRFNIDYIPESFDLTTQVTIDQSLIQCVAYGRPISSYEPKKENIALDAYYFLNIMQTYSIDTVLSSYKIEKLMQPFLKDKWVSYVINKCVGTDSSKQYLMKYANGLDLNVRLAFAFGAALIIDDKVSVKNFFVTANKPYLASQYLKEFKNEKHVLLTSKIFEIEKNNFGDDIFIRWGKMSKELIFKGKEELLVTNAESKELGKITADKIPEKTLFYNESNQKDIDRLTALIEEKQYQGIRSRLKEKHLPLGVTALFYGAPGTGKTETAMQLARMTGRDVYHLNIEQIKSCWVGESEKNIKNVFEAYKQHSGKLKPILLFNEADAIISKRTVIEGDSNPAVSKMDNAIQNIVLEELEKFDGIFIATTNMIDNFDSAFDRRFLFKLKFDSPSTSVKSKIWKSKVSWLNDEDAYTLSSKFDLSGGQIENIYRKSEIDYILYGRNPTIEEMISFCEKERLDASGRAKPIGFC